MSNPKPNVLPALQKQCEQWNKLYPIGTPVTARRENSETVKTHTATEAQILNNHAVIWLEGIPPYFDLNRVYPDYQRINNRRDKILTASRYRIVVPANREVVLMLEGRQGEVFVSTEGNHPTVIVQNDPAKEGEKFTFDHLEVAPCEASLP